MPSNARSAHGRRSSGDQEPKATVARTPLCGEADPLESRTALPASTRQRCEPEIALVTTWSRPSRRRCPDSRSTQAPLRSPRCRSSREESVDGYIDESVFADAARRRPRSVGGARRVAEALHGLGQEAGGLPVSVRVVATTGSVVVAGGNVDVQPAPRAGQSDVEEPPLLGDPLLAASVHIRS